MTLDWSNFTPVSAHAGGILIGLAIAILLLASGRIAGVSGIVGGLLKPRRGDNAWRIAFTAGLVAAPMIYSLFTAQPESRIDASWPVLVIAGLLVGFGTRLGSGCTSGHGVCGMSRLSPRSILATLTFMGCGFATVFVVRYLVA